METSYFWETEYTLPPDAPGFSHFCPGHIVWLGSAVLLCAVICAVYRRLRENERLTFRKVLAVPLICDELFKYGIAIYSGDFRPSFLPLHLCSINIFLIAADAIKPNELLQEVLYAVCLPGAFFALAFPGWNYLPLWNALCIHSFTAHILLLLYPAALVVTVLVACFNMAFGTNFMFLARAGEGNPLSWFERFLGSPGYLIGIPLIAAVCWAVLYGVPKLREKT